MKHAVIVTDAGSGRAGKLKVTVRKSGYAAGSATLRVTR
jgi:hypothetical protein